MRHLGLGLLAVGAIALGLGLASGPAGAPMRQVGLLCLCVAVGVLLGELGLRALGRRVRLQADEVRALLQDMVPELLDDDGTQLRQAEGFATDLNEITVQSVFDRLWTRPGLDRRSRSLVTLGILIALRAGDELAFHLLIAQRNGLTPAELEEVVYHSSAYAGFPAAASAARVGRRVLRDEPQPRQP